MVLKLYGAAISTCTRRVAIALAETNTPFELHEVDFMKGELTSPAYLEKQPFGQMPYIDDNGFILYESRSIARYVAQKAGSPLVPRADDIEALAKYDQAQNVEAFDFEAIVGSGLCWELYFKVWRGGQTDEARVEELKATLKKKLAGYERILSKTKYITGDEISLVDLFHIVHGSMLAPKGIDYLEDEKTFPNVARWWKDITSRPSWQKHKDGVVV